MFSVFCYLFMFVCVSDSSYNSLCSYCYSRCVCVSVYRREIPVGGALLFSKTTPCWSSTMRTLGQPMTCSREDWGWQGTDHALASGSLGNHTSGSPTPRSCGYIWSCMTVTIIVVLCIQALFIPYIQMMMVIVATCPLSDYLSFILCCM